MLVVLVVVSGVTLTWLWRVKLRERREMRLAERTMTAVGRTPWCTRQVRSIAQNELSYAVIGSMPQSRRVSEGCARDWRRVALSRRAGTLEFQSCQSPESKA